MLIEKLKALVVDDDPIARKTVGFALSKEDFSCAYAADGEDALKRMSTERFDLVVTDLRMPNKNGHALAVELLARGQCPVIVVHSSIDDPRLTKDLMTRGIDDIVYKPANYAAFAAKTKALVQRRKRSAAQAGAAPALGSETAVDASGSPSANAAQPPDALSPVPPISRAEYERRLANVQHLFPLSSAAYDVFCLSTSEQTTTSKLVSTMLRDAALTADVLRLANSAFYNRNNRPTIDVEEAVVRIGFKKIGEVALALNALGAFRGCILPWLDADLGQARSLAASIALERLCEVREYRTINDGMTLSAFLHPLGRLLLGSAFQDEYQLLIRACLERQLSLCELESHVFPENHTAALSRVLSQWNLPGDIWGPLPHLGDSYESIARLEDPVRGRSELIKLAVFIGDIAVGNWNLWDQIEPPPLHVLARHHLTRMAPTIEQTRADLGHVAQAHKPSASQTGSARPAPLKGERRQRVPYLNLSDSGGDWMPLLLASLGFDTIAPEMDEGEGQASLLVNCLNANSRDLAAASERNELENRKPVFLTAPHITSDIEKVGPTIQFPISVAGLKASCEKLAQPIGHAP